MSWDDGKHAKVKRVQLTFDDVIRSIEVEYDGTSLKSQQRGTAGTKFDGFTLSPDEYITEVNGYYKTVFSGDVITALTFKTNKKTYGPYGDKTRNYFSLTAPKNNQIAGFLGSSTNALNSIDAHFAPVPSPGSTGTNPGSGGTGTNPGTGGTGSKPGGSTGGSNAGSTGTNPGSGGTGTNPGTGGTGSKPGGNTGGSNAGSTGTNPGSGGTGINPGTGGTGSNPGGNTGGSNAGSTGTNPGTGGTGTNPGSGGTGINPGTGGTGSKPGGNTGGSNAGGTGTNPGTGGTETKPGTGATGFNPGGSSNTGNTGGSNAGNTGTNPGTGGTGSNNNSSLEKVEAQGGKGGNQWDDGTDHDGVIKIYVAAGGRGIEQIRFDYIKNGQSKEGPAHGVKGRSVISTIVISHPDEYLVSVKGCYDSSNIIQGIQFKTNTKTSDYFGYDDGRPFSLEVKDKKIVGFHGFADTHLNSLGAYFAPISTSSASLTPPNKVEAQGGNYGETFDDGAFDQVRKVYVGQGDSGVAYVKLDYEKDGKIETKEHGKMTVLGTEEFVVDSDDYITSIEVYIDNVYGFKSEVVTALVFKTFKGKTSPPFGMVTEKKFELKDGKGGKLAGFHGKASDVLYALGAYFTPKRV